MQHNTILPNRTETYVFMFVVLQFTLLEYFSPGGFPVGQFLGIVDATNKAALKGVKQMWGDPVRFSFQMMTDGDRR
jgi:hypothetical protein